MNEYPIAVGSFGCWRSGLTVSWSAIEERNMTQEDRTKHNRAIQQMSQVNDEEKAKANLEAAVIAEQLWDQANDVSSAHPYLVSKKVDAFGIKHNGQRLLIPLRDRDGKLWNLQQIFPNGKKRFLKNGKVKGLFHNIGEQTDVIYIGEGYATIIGFRVYKQAPEATPNLYAFNDQCLKKLRQKTDLANPQILTFSNEAHRFWEEYYNFVERAQGKDGPYEYHTPSASKSAEQAARIAAVFTLLSEDNAKEVGLLNIQRGIKIAQWFLEESLRLSGHLSISKGQQNAASLLEWLKDLEIDNETPLKVGDLLKFGPRPIRKKKERDDAVKILADLGWIQVRKWRNSKIILLHPSIGKV